MPDTAELEMPGSSSGGSGIPQWVMVVGAVAGIAGLVLLLKNQGGGGTTAAGSSINAALGSIQEENMNLLGTTQAGFMQMGQSFTNLGSQMDTSFASTNDMLTQGFLNTQTGFGSLGTQIGAGFSNTNSILGHLQQDISGQISALSSQSQSNYQGLYNLVASGQASQAQIDQAQSNLLSSLQADVTAGLIGQTQANSALASIEQQIGSAIHAPAQSAMNFNLFNNSFIYSAADSTTYKVVNGSLYDVGFWARSNFPGTPSIATPMSLKQYSLGSMHL